MIQANPHLLGYYRLLYGFSQKSFYQQGPFGRFKGVEERGEIRRQIRGDIDSLCRSLVGTGELLVSGLDTLSLSIVQDLQVITIGSQLRGFQNTEIGQDATKEVFELLKSIVSPYITSSTNTTITIRNNTNRTVLIEFRSDPDIGIIETLTTEDRKLIAMEIKGGTDISNVWNRLGEAEKSHSDAKREGFLEFWTILGVDIDPSDGRRRSPTTNRFFYLHRIKDPNTEEHKRFRELLSSIMSIPT